MGEDPSAATSIVEALGDMVWVRDARTFELLYVSRNAQAFLGLGPDTPYTSETFFDAVHPDDRPRLAGALVDAPDTYTLDFRFYKRGELRWASSRALHVYDETGARVRVEGCTTDVTDRVRREEELRIGKQRGEVLMRIAEKLSALVRVDDAMRMVCEETALALSAPSVVAALYEPTTGDLVAQYGHGLTSNREPTAAPYPMVIQVAARGVSQIVDMQADPNLLHSDKIKTYDVRSLAFACFVRQGEVLGYLNVITYGEMRELSPDELALLKGIADLAVGALANARLFADKERVAARLRESEKRYREIVETTREGIAVIDGDGVFTYTNRRFGEIFDLLPDELVGKRYLDFVRPENVESLKERLALRFAGTTARFENTTRTRTGREVCYSSTATRVGEQGREAILVVVSDITEARRLAEKLQSAQKAESLGVLAGGVAHDFNNLLVSVLGNAGVALMELPPQSPVRAIVEDIQTAALRASELTRQLLAYSGRGRFVIARIDLGRVVEEMAHLLSAVIGKNVRIEYALGHELPRIEGDPTQIRQLAMNLITNASDAIGERAGTITVTTRLVDVDRAHLADTYLDDRLAPGVYVCLQVSDDGAGMTPETRAKIFDPFFSTKFTGRGLGLAAALGILRAHRGAIDVESEVGRGTTFKVLFPAAPPAVDAPTIPAVSVVPSPSSAATVLVVDDDASVRSVVKRILAQQGYTVLVAGDGDEALEVYAQNLGRIDAVVLDVTMPRMSGEETFRRLCEMDPTVRVLLSSGYSEQEATSHFAGKGLAGFLAKPFTPAELLERVRAMLAQ